VSTPITSIAGYDPNYAYAGIGPGAQGDLVVWAQEHLVGAGYHISVDGGYGPQTQSAVRRFQSAHHLHADGVLGNITWSVLLRYPTARVHWAKDAARTALAASGGIQPVPKSAHLPAKHDELRGAPGRGLPKKN
jgi:peptidoglycan hydrolase-like protein with peptidoglycan-binding domain